ncbi:acyltransferase family protein [Marinobacter salexigens]|uniref:Acyltransferase family protein n=1 Tax=Marinobacter salexigens TaxID=1925763 RepID=A0ABS6AB91_9GAMM|nr:acyltransferase family protein [Marinobacter salexigens]
MLSKERIHYMDSMRAILMILGILLHAANIFSPNQVWLISSDESNILFSGISGFINLFRMPAFFMVSGFFFSYTYLRKQRVDIVDRILRLLVPLVFTALTLNVIQEIVLSYYNSKSLDLLRFFTEGRWVSHLWFLINLSVYNVVVWVAFLFKPTHIFLKKTSSFFSGKWAYLLMIVAFPFIIDGIYALNSVVEIYKTIFNVGSVFILLFYFQFFVVGLFLGYSKELLFRFSSPKVIDLVVFLLAYGVSWCIKKSAIEDSVVYDISAAYNYSILIIFLSSICFSLFKRFLDYRSRFLGLVSESAYSIYLLHHVLVILFGIVFLSLPVNIYVAYPVIVILTFIVTMLAHQKIKKSSLLLFLLNGVRPKNLSKS